MISLIISIGFMICSNTFINNINCDDNSSYGIIFNTCYDAIYKNSKNCVKYLYYE